MAAIDVPSLDVWDMLYVKLNEVARVIIKMKMVKNWNVQATLLAILVKRLTTQQKIRLLNT